MSGPALVAVAVDHPPTSGIDGVDVADDLGPLVGGVVNVHVVIVDADRPAVFRVVDDDVGIGSRLERSFPGVQAHHAGRGR